MPAFARFKTLICLLFVVIVSCDADPVYSEFRESRQFVVPGIGKTSGGSDYAIVHAVGAIVKVDLESGLLEPVFTGLRDSIVDIKTSSYSSHLDSHIITYLDSVEGLKTILLSSGESYDLTEALRVSIAERSEGGQIDGIITDFQQFSRDVVFGILPVREPNPDSPAGYSVRKDIVAINIQQMRLFTLVHGVPAGVGYLVSRDGLYWYLRERDGSYNRVIYFCTVEIGEDVTIRDVSEMTIPHNVESLRFVRGRSTAAEVVVGTGVIRVNKDTGIEELIDSDAMLGIDGKIIYVDESRVVTAETRGLSTVFRVYE